MKTILLRILYFGLIPIVVIYFGFQFFNKQNLNSKYTIGQKIDSLNGVYVYYNGGVGHVLNRNTAPDGYNLGLKYQCVEFVKRYYYQYYHHKMPNSYGHAKDYFNATLSDGELNKQRNLIQYLNPSKVKPQTGDLLVYSGTVSNPYGHVAIISKVKDDKIEIIQQNPGAFGDSRVEIGLVKVDKTWKIENDRINCWLRKTN